EARAGAGAEEAQAGPHQRRQGRRRADDLGEELSANEAQVTDAGRQPQIRTLAPEEISRFLMRTRRDRDPERYEVRLDEHLREVLARADDFVPSDEGAILLDDPRPPPAWCAGRRAGWRPRRWG